MSPKPHTRMQKGKLFEVRMTTTKKEGCVAGKNYSDGGEERMIRRAREHYTNNGGLKVVGGHSDIV